MASVTLFQLPQNAEQVSSILPAATQADRMREIAERIAPMYVLRNTGYRPFAFNGELLATVCGIDEVLPYWYEINVYQTVLDAYVSDIRLFTKGMNATDLFHVKEHGDEESLQTYLEKYDPCCDLPPIRYDKTATAAAVLTLRAIEVQAEMRCITDHYRLTIGALLNALPR